MPKGDVKKLRQKGSRLKKAAPPPSHIVKQVTKIKKKETFALFEKRPRNFGIGQAIRPKVDLTRYVRWPKNVYIQRKKAVLMKRLKIPPTIHQFSQCVAKNIASQILKLMAKYRPESDARKAMRRQKLAEKLAKNKPETKEKRQFFVRYGANKVTTLIEQKRAKLVVIAHDVDPIEIVLFLPALCRKMGVPYCIIKSKARLGVLVRKKTCSCVCITDVEANDRTSLNKIMETVKNNYNERGEEIRKTWGGGQLSKKSMARKNKIEKAKAKEIAKRMF